MAKRSVQPTPLSVRLHVPLAADLAVVAENIASLRAREVELVFAPGHPIAASMASLRTLKNTATKTGKRVKLVTDNPAQAQLAERAGWEVSLEKKRAGVVSKPAATPTTPRRRYFPIYLSRWQRRLWLGFAMVALVLALAVGWLIVPGATVILKVKTEPFVQTLSLNVLPPQENGRQGTPVGMETQLVAAPNTHAGSWRDNFPTTGRKKEGTTARGWVKLINRTAETIPLRQYSRLAPEGRPEVVLRTQRGVHIPAKGGVRVEVVAEEAGEEANLPAGTKLYFLALPPSARSILYAEVAEQLQGGAAKEFAVVTEEDIKQAREKLLSRAREEISKIAREQTPPTHIFLEQTLQLEVISQSVRPQTGEKADKVTAQLEAKAKWWTLDKEKIARVLRMKTEQLLAGERMFLAPPTWPEPSLKREGEQLFLQYALNFPVARRIDTAALQEALATRRREDAFRYLQTLPGVQEAVLELRPPWRQRLPSNPESIEVKIEAAGG
jgi:hypothetical protein